MTNKLPYEIMTAITKAGIEITNRAGDKKLHFGTICAIIEDNLLPYLSISKEEEPKVCTACLGKKYVSVCSQEVGHDDFGGEGYVKKPEVKMLNCSRCEATGLEPIYKQVPTPEQQSDKPKIEKIDITKILGLYAILSTDNQEIIDQKIINRIEIVWDKLSEAIDTINTQQEQIDYLITQAKGKQS